MQEDGKQGRKEGKIYLVGLGPGARSLVAPAAQDALSLCDTIVGYRGYLDSIADLLPGKRVVATELGEEIQRAKKAVEAACDGCCVAVVSSGDAGVYGMAGPVFQVLSQKSREGQVPGVEVIPGITALQAAAALLGAPLMQDFCAISLSDLITPWQAIRKRLKAAAEADFVVVLYNPRSRKRTWQMQDAWGILLEYRHPQTPVGIARNAYRSGQQVLLTTLGSLPEHFDSVDMFTTLVVGNSTSYAHDGYMITPRGYTFPEGEW